jgi:SAM-dependent methyltransferase
VDIRKEYTTTLARELGIPALTVDLSKKALFRASFDSAVCLNVLEHIEAQEQALRSIFKALRPGGRFAVLVPAFNWLYGPVDAAIQHHRRYNPPLACHRPHGSRLCCPSYQLFHVFGVAGWFWRNRIRKKANLSDGSLTLFDRLVPFSASSIRPSAPCWGSR